MRREQGILYADIHIARVAPARRTLDVTGHYARPDIFELRVRRTPAVPIRYNPCNPVLEAEGTSPQQGQPRALRAP
jgi:hypothetical protein